LLIVRLLRGKETPDEEPCRLARDADAQETEP
jgi:hypothetical protein